MEPREIQNAQLCIEGAYYIPGSRKMFGEQIFWLNRLPSCHPELETEHCAVGDKVRVHGKEFTITLKDLV